MKNSKNRVEEFIRVDHAGERGAIKIYEGQLLALNTLVKDEEVIDKHYLDQINQLGHDEKELKSKIIKFREDELHHKDIAYEKGATKKGIYSILDKVIKTGSKIAINISEKF